MLDGADLRAGEKDARPLVDAARIRIFDPDPVIAAKAFAEAAE